MDNCRPDDNFQVTNKNNLGDCSNISYKIYQSMLEKSDDTFAKIAKLRWNTPDNKIYTTVSWMKRNHFGENLKTKWFEVTAYNNMNEIVGFSFFMQNPQKAVHWYLGDLTVEERYRRQHIATNMIRMGLKTVLNYGGKCVYAYIEKDNIASINLHEKVGFRNLERLEPFAEFINGDDQTTFECKL